MNVAVKDFDPDLILYFNNIRRESFKCLKSFEYCLIFIESHCVFFYSKYKAELDSGQKSISDVEVFMAKLVFANGSILDVVKGP